MNRSTFISDTGLHTGSSLLASARMTKKQQFENLFQGKESAKIFFKPILMHFAARFSGKTYGLFASDYRVLVESNIRCLEYFDLDAVSLISDPYRETSAFGAPIQFVDEGVPKCLRTIIKSYEDVKELAIPDISSCQRTADRIKGAKYYRQLLKGDVPVGGWIEGPLAEACTLAGVSEMLVCLMTDPDLSNFLMDKCMVVAREFARVQINEGCDYIGIGDSICSQIDPGTYDLYVRDRHKELVDYIHSLGAKAKLHICGNIEHLLYSCSGLGFDIIDLDWQVEMKKAREILGDNVVLKGNFNPVFLQDYHPDQIEEQVGKLIAMMGKSKFILSAGCEITVNTPAVNLMKMSELSRYLG